MDCRAFFKKVHEVESTIAGEYAVVTSLETSDGGRPGQATEVSRAVAARLVVEGKARLATEDEARDYHAMEAQVRAAIKEAESMDRLKVTIVPDRNAEDPRPRPKK